MRMLRALLPAVVLAFMASSGARAHDTPAGPIAELTRRIWAQPDAAALYLERGELRRIQGDIVGARADYAQVERLDPANPRLDLCRAALALDTANPALARERLDVALAARPDNADALRLRARASVALGDRRGAIADLGRAIDRLEQPHPDLFLERARLQLAEGDRPAARAGLEEARRRLGPVASLEQFAIELELADGHAAAARSRLDALRGQYADPAPLAELSARIEAAGGGPEWAMDVVPAGAAAGAITTPSRTAGGTFTASAVAATTALPRNSVWKYDATGTDLGTGWRATSYDDTAWPSGPGILGFGDPFITTTVPYGPNPSAKYTTSYFRTSFTVSGPTAGIQAMSMSANYDDGFVAYLNGVEVARRSLPGGTILYGTFATNHEGGAYETIDLSAHIGILVTGANLLAVEVHQRDPASSDLAWDMDLSYSDQAQVSRGPYLQMGTQDAVTVRWRTDVATDTWVRYGTSPASLTSTASNATPTTEHELRLTSLSAGTRYYYSVGTSVAPLAGDASYTFVTAPVAGPSTSTRAWVIGDSGQPGFYASAVRDAYATWTGTRGTDLWLMLGDNAYQTGTDSEFQAGVFDQYPVMLRQAVLWPTRGNHDFIYGGANDDYYDLFTMPTAAEAGGVVSGTEAYYGFDWGQVHFVCLDSEGSDRSPGGAMLTWLANDLAANTKPWVVAYWHHPPYTKGSHDSDDDLDSGGRMRDMRQNALPILEAAGVDLVLTGHSHSYERSYLLDGHYGVSSTLTPAMKLDAGDGRVDGDGPYVKPPGEPPGHAGEVFAVAGNGSQISGGALNHPAMVSSLNLWGSMVLDVTADRLDARFLSHTGVVLDSFVIDKTDNVTAVPPGVGAGGLQLGPGMPNPFTLDTRMSFNLPHAQRIRLTLLDASGRRVATLAEGWHEAGVHGARWDGRDDHGRPMPTGVYLAILEANGTRVSRKVAHVR